jgi:hypothetical protein
MRFRSLGSLGFHPLRALMSMCGGLVSQCNASGTRFANSPNRPRRRLIARRAGSWRPSMVRLRTVSVDVQRNILTPRTAFTGSATKRPSFVTPKMSPPPPTRHSMVPPSVSVA